MLFITHNTSIYGAARSLKELLCAYRNAEIDLMVPKYFGASDDDELRQFFGPYVRRIFRQWLPFDPCYRGRPPVLLGFQRHSVIFPFAWALTQGSLYAFVKRQKYDAIHLNSVVLHPLIRPEFPFIIHVREIVDIHLAEVRRGLGQAHGVVFIDQATEAPFRNSPLRRSIILNTPIDMRRVPEVGTPKEAVQRLGGEPERLVVFTMVGAISSEKGLDFVIRSFRFQSRPDTRLLIVGRGDRFFMAKCRALAGGDARIIFWGAEPDIERIYQLSDYVVRGESYPCVGRTIYEGLFAGCSVVVPGTATDGSKFFEYDRFSDKMHLYAPRSADALTALFEHLGMKKVGPKVGISNVDEYVRSFDSFVRDCVGNGRAAA